MRLPHLYTIFALAFFITYTYVAVEAQPQRRQETQGGNQQRQGGAGRGEGRRQGQGQGGRPNRGQGRRQGPRQQIVHPVGPTNIVADSATLQTLGKSYQFTEGPAVNAQGEIFFTDLRVSRIYRIALDEKISVWRENTGGANGLYFDANGNLVICESDNGRIISINPAGDVTVLASEYNGKRFNKPNDLWIDPLGGVYFTDPAYGREVVLYQDGEHVYYITPDRQKVIRVIDDLIKPNGLIGAPNGKVLYVADPGAGKTYRYNINPDGSLSDKTLFVSSGSDGMTIDNLGNIYLTTDSVLVFNVAGKQIDQIKTSDRPTNVTFGGTGRKTLFITARSTVHSIQTRVHGIRPVNLGTPSIPGFVFIDSGSFVMGDHHGLGGQEHRNDEVPVHKVSIDALYVSVYETTNTQYCEFLQEELAAKHIKVEEGIVYGDGGIYFETRAAVAHSNIDWDGKSFRVVEKKGNHPVVWVRWEGAAAYCNWLSRKHDLSVCYDLSAGTCNYTRNGYRLPTEAEWEYAGRGDSYDPYYIYPWGDDPDISKANWPQSGDPYEAGSLPLTTPVGFYNGQLHSKEDFNWPGKQLSYQTRDGSNSYGLYDIAGNVWEWCNDWYVNPYYESSPSDNPPGPVAGSPMPDGNPYRVLRSGSWYNGPQGHSRVSNRNPAHFRGPQDPNHPYYHIGFRIVRDYEGDGPRKNQTLTPVSRQRERRTDSGRNHSGNTARGVQR